MLSAKDRILQNPRVTMTGHLVGAGTLASSDDDDDDSRTTSSSSTGVERSKSNVSQEQSLSQLIRNHKFEEAIDRVRARPEEAAEWIEERPSNVASSSCHCRLLTRQDSWPATDRAHRKRRRLLRRRQEVFNDEQNHFVYRQLPIHLACQCLAADKLKSGERDSSISIAEALIRELTQAHPQSCSVSDANGSLPLHEAIAWGASTGTLTAIMVAFPEALCQRDASGWLPLERNAMINGPDSDEVEKLLLDAYRVCQNARADGMLRYHMGRSLLSRDKETEDSFFSVSQAIEHSLSPLSSIYQEARGEGSLSLQAKQVLKDVYECNQVLVEAISSLKAENKRLNAQDGTNESFQKLTYDLGDENADLRRSLLERELIFHDHGLDASGGQLYPGQPVKEKAMCMTSMDPEPPTALTKYLETKVAELSEENDQLQSRIEQICSETESLKEKVKNLESEKTEQPVVPPGPSDDERALMQRIEELEKLLADARQENQSLKQQLTLPEAGSVVGLGSQQLPKKPNAAQKNPDFEDLQTAASNFEQGFVENQGGEADHPDDCSNASGKKSRISRKSTTSWGMLSLAQRPPRKAAKTKLQTPLAALLQEKSESRSSSSSPVRTGVFHGSLNLSVDKSNLPAAAKRHGSAEDIYDFKRGKQDSNRRHGSTSVLNAGSSKKNRHRNKQAEHLRFTAADKKWHLRKSEEMQAEALADTAKMLAAEEEIMAIIKQTEEQLQKEIPSNLVAILRESALEQAISDSANELQKSTEAGQLAFPISESVIDYSLIKAAETKYGGTIPSDVVYGLRAAAIVCIENSQQEIEAMEMTKRRLEKELLDALIETAERQLHKQLPAAVTAALCEAADSFDSLLKEEFDDEGQLTSIQLNFKEMERMFDKSQHLLKGPFSEDVIVALRRASFVLQSRLDGTDFSDAQESSERTHSSGVIGNPSSIDMSRSRVPNAEKQDISNKASAACRNTEVSLQIALEFPTLANHSLERDQSERRSSPYRLDCTESSTEGSEAWQQEITEDSEFSEPLQESDVELEPTPSKPEDFSTVVEAAKAILGRDITPELLEAIRILPQVSGIGASKVVPLQQQSRGSRWKQPAYSGRGMNRDGRESEDDEIKSTDQSRQSEMSLNLSAVFSQKAPSDLERKLKSLDGGRKGSMPVSMRSRGEADMALPGLPGVPSLKVPYGKTSTRGRSPKRGVSKSRSGDVNLLAEARKVVPEARRARSAERSETLNTVSIVEYVVKSGVDDLSQLYQHAVGKADGDANLLASTLHMEDMKGVFAFNAIISDTEETYGVEIPTDLLVALRGATMERFEDQLETPFILIAKSIHDDTVIQDAEQRAGRVFPPDLLGAIRSTSLPPGVSVETLRPADGSSSSIPAKKYNTSIGSMALSLGLTDSSSRRSHFTNTATIRGSSSHRGSSLGNRIAGMNDSIGATISTQSSNRDAILNLNPVNGNNSSLPKDGHLNPVLESGSNHSDNSWGKLSLSASKSSGSRNRGKKERLRNKKGTKEAMFERAQKRKDKMAIFMNSLADLGAADDDLRTLLKQARETLESESPSLSESRKRLPGATGTSSPTLQSKAHLHAVMETGSDNSDSIDSTSDVQRSLSLGIVNPGGYASCIITSPQEAELDILLARFTEIAGRGLPFEIDIAVRKASRSMDESLDMIAATTVLAENQVFGKHLSAEKLELICGEASIFLGRDIDEGILDTLIRASRDLFEVEEELGANVQKLSESYASILSTDKSPWKGEPKSRLVDSLIGVAESNEDDLGALYRVAYDQAPRTSAVSRPGHDLNNSGTSQDPGAVEIPLTEDLITRTQVPSKAQAIHSPTTPTFGTHSANHPLNEIRGDAERFEKTESGRFLSAVSPMTEASHYTAGSDMQNSELFGEDKLRRIPKLDDSDVLLDYEDDYLNLQEESDGSSVSEEPLEDDDTSYASSDASSEEMSLKGEMVGGQDDELPEDDEMAEDSKSAEDAESSVGRDGSSTHVSVDDSEYNGNVSFTSMELNAIISEAKEAYGMELPPELVEALKSASAATLSHDFDSCAESVSSIFLKHMSGDEEAVEAAVIENVTNNVSNSNEGAIRSVTRRLEVEDYVDTLIKGAQAHCESEIPEDFLRDAWQFFFTRCSNEKGFVRLSPGEVRAVLFDTPQLRAHLSDSLVEAFETASSTLSRQASGYISSASSVASESIGDFQSMHDVSASSRAVSESTTGNKRDSLNDISMSSGLLGTRFAGSTNFEYSADLDYSESTTRGSSHHKKPAMPNSFSQRSRIDGSLVTIDESEKQSGADAFLTAMEKEYQQKLLAALESTSNRALLRSDTGSGDGAEESSLGPEDALPPELAAAISRAAAKTSKDFTPLSSEHWQNSNISALTGYTETSEWGPDHDVKAGADDSESMDSLHSSGEAAPQTSLRRPPPGHPPQNPSAAGPDVASLSSTHKTSSTNGNLGSGLMKELKQIYKRKIPMELSYVLSRSQVLASAQNTDEEIQIILTECEDMSGKRLPADLVLALREASVNLRAHETSSSRRSKLIRHSSDSHRSRSSGMPSIQEWESSTASESIAGNFEVDRVPSSFGGHAIPSEIAAEERSTMDLSTLKDSQHTDGTSNKTYQSISKKNKSHAQRMEPLNSSGRRDSTKSVSKHSINVDALFNSSNFATVASPALSGAERKSPWMSSPSTFNASTATMLISNTDDLRASKVRPPPFEAIDDDGEASENGEDIPVSWRSNNTSMSGTSHASSTSTEVTQNYSTTVSAVTEVSRASTLPSCRLPIGVNYVPPLDGIETDDLSAIFKEAARRFYK